MKAFELYEALNNNIFDMYYNIAASQGDQKGMDKYTKLDNIMSQYPNVTIKKRGFEMSGPGGQGPIDQQLPEIGKVMPKRVDTVKGWMNSIKQIYAKKNIDVAFTNIVWLLAPVFTRYQASVNLGMYTLLSGKSENGDVVEYFYNQSSYAESAHGDVLINGKKFTSYDLDLHVDNLAKINKKPGKNDAIVKFMLDYGISEYDIVDSNTVDLTAKKTVLSDIGSNIHPPFKIRKANSLKISFDRLNDKDYENPPNRSGEDFSWLPSEVNGDLHIDSMGVYNSLNVFPFRKINGKLILEIGLKSFEGCPEGVRALAFHGAGNSVSKQCPPNFKGLENSSVLRRIDFEFLSSRNLQSFEGCPPTVKKIYIQSYSSLKSLNGLPSTLRELELADDHKLTTLEGLPKSLSYFKLSYQGNISPWELRYVLTMPKLEINPFMYMFKNAEIKNKFEEYFSKSLDERKKAVPDMLRWLKSLPQ